MDCSAIVLNKLLVERNLDIWAKLKLAFLDSAYGSVYSAISKHYDKYSELPSFEELEIQVREGITSKTLATLKLIDEPDISADVALDALIDQYTQNLTLGLLDKFVDKLPQYDSKEIKDNLATITLTVDEKTLNTENVFNMSELILFKSASELASERVFLGLNNDFDIALGGVAIEELIMVGGKRGAGKSIVCSNVCNNQYEMGNSCVYFTIEMKAHEVNERNASIGAGIPYNGLKKGELTDDEWLRLVRYRANMFEDADYLVQEYLAHKDRFRFENDLVKKSRLKSDNQIIIVDDRALSLSSIDLHLGKLKARFGPKLKVGVIDYVNQIVIEGTNQFDWQPQIVVSKKLKELARKHKVALVSPYQIDETGEARFAKGILDAADIALILEAGEESISMKTTKIRSAGGQDFTSKMDWNTLRLSAESVAKPVPKEKEKSGKKSKAPATVDDSKSDIPWDV